MPHQSFDPNKPAWSTKKVNYEYGDTLDRIWIEKGGFLLIDETFETSSMLAITGHIRSVAGSLNSAIGGNACADPRSVNVFLETAFSSSEEMRSLVNLKHRFPYIAATANILIDSLDVLQQFLRAGAITAKDLINTIESIRNEVNEPDVPFPNLLGYLKFFDYFSDLMQKVSWKVEKRELPNLGSYDESGEFEGPTYNASLEFVFHELHKRLSWVLDVALDEDPDWFKQCTPGYDSHRVPAAVSTIFSQRLRGNKKTKFNRTYLFGPPTNPEVLEDLRSNWKTT